MHARLEEQGVILTLQGLEILMAFRRHLRIPFSWVRGVEAGVAVEPTRRLLGTSLGWLRFGLFCIPQGRAFFATRDPRRAVTLWLEGGGFSALVMDVEDPDAFITGLLDRLRR
jgi:hypothetical protein